MILTQALIGKLTAWQAAGNGLCVYPEGEIERIGDLASLTSGMRVEISVFQSGSPVVEITEANWFEDYETLICEEDVQRCREQLQRAEARLAQLKRAALAS